MSGKHVIAAALMLGTLTGHSRSPVPAAMPRELVGHEAAQPRLQPGGPIERPGAEPTLAEILGGPGNTREANTLVRAAERRYQQALAACMARSGFQYVPHIGVVGSLTRGSGLPSGLPADEFRRRYGYGVAAGFKSALNLSPEPIEPDPNEAIRAAMTAQDQAAYDRALHGSIHRGNLPGGCQAQAPDPIPVAGTAGELEDDLNELQSRIDADEHVVTARLDWTECMSRAGYPFSDDQQIQDDLLRRMNPLYDAIAGEDIPAGMTLRVYDRQLSPQQDRLLNDIASYERDLAATDTDCRRRLDDALSNARTVYETQFINQHRDRLRELHPDAGL